MRVYFEPKMKIRAYQGCYVVKPTTDQSPITFSSEKKGRLLKGQIVDCGDTLESKYGGHLNPYLKVGTTIYFLSYEGDYDNTKINGELHYFVLADDVRGYEE